MQAWGAHTYEDYRPSHPFPTRSGLAGLLGACVGIERSNHEGLRQLNASFRYAVRLDGPVEDRPQARLRRITDFHTVLEARKVSGKPADNPVVSRREYLCDASYTVALAATAAAALSLDQLATGVQRPRYTPFLGRRSCPLGAPLFVALTQADSLHAALAATPPGRGMVYSEDPDGTPNAITVRDVPVYGRSRQFQTRTVFVYPEAPHVPEQVDHT